MQIRQNAMAQFPSSVMLRRLALLTVFLVGMLAPVLLQTFPSLRVVSSSREIARVASQDGREDAVLVEVESGLIRRQQSWAVHVVPHGMPIGKGPSIFSARQVTDGSIAWVEASLLQIRYRRARIDYFTNSCSSPNDEKYPAIEVRLAPLSAGFSYLQRATATTFQAEPPADRY